MDTQTSKSATIVKFLSAVFSLLFLTGIIFMSLGLSATYPKHILSFKNYTETIEKTDIQAQKDTLSRPAKIIIEDAGINLPVEEAQIRNGVWEVSDINASYLASSAKPGGNGNIVIYGHNKKDIFSNLITSVKLGNEIEIYNEDGKKYKYRVKSVVTVSPDNLELVLPTDYEVLTIYTCTGFLDSERLIITADPILS